MYVCMRYVTYCSIVRTVCKCIHEALPVLSFCVYVRTPLIALHCAVLDGMGWDGLCLIIAEYLSPYPAVGLM